jgi:hypothetical protein
VTLADTADATVIAAELLRTSDLSDYLQPRLFGTSDETVGLVREQLIATSEADHKNSSSIPAVAAQAWRRNAGNSGIGRASPATSTRRWSQEGKSDSPGRYQAWFRLRPSRYEPVTSSEPNQASESTSRLSTNDGALVPQQTWRSAHHRQGRR